MHWFQNRHLFMFEMIMEEEEKAPFLWMQLCDIKLKSVVILFQMTIAFFFFLVIRCAPCFRFCLQKLMSCVFLYVCHLKKKKVGKILL